MKKTVLTFGSFDILHPGHIYYLEEARKLGDKLIVIVARDRSVFLMKGKKPIFNERQRLKIISSLKVVDGAVLGNKILKKGEIYKILSRYRPNVVALGHDQHTNMAKLKKELDSRNIQARVVRIKLLPGKLNKSSVIKSLIKKS